MVSFRKNICESCNLNCLGIWSAPKAKNSANTCEIWKSKYLKKVEKISLTNLPFMFMEMSCKFLDILFIDLDF